MERQEIQTDSMQDSTLYRQNPSLEGNKTKKGLKKKKNVQTEQKQ